MTDPDRPGSPPPLAPLAEREREYSPSSCIGGDYQPFLDAYRQRSAEARERAAALGGRWTTVRYGPKPAQRIELCLPSPPFPLAPRCGLLAFVHGGYWQELGAADSLFAAAGCIANGVAFAAIDYTLAPTATVAEIVAEVRRAMRWLAGNGPEQGIAPDDIVLAGSSAGAHLAAMASLVPFSVGAQPRAVVLVSGVYWLAPLVGTSINEALGLDAAEASELSPGLRPLGGFPPALVCWGEIETLAFKGQSRLFAEALSAGGTRCEAFEIAGRNHFDVILDLADASTPLGQRTLGLFAAR